MPSVREDKSIRNVVVPVGAPAQMAGTVRLPQMEQVLGCVFQDASAHRDWCRTMRASVCPSACAPVCKGTRHTSPDLFSRITVTPGMYRKAIPGVNHMVTPGFISAAAFLFLTSYMSQD